MVLVLVVKDLVVVGVAAAAILVVKVKATGLN